jgi:hypothetical protein
MTTEEVDIFQKDQLFIQTGEDVEDIITAWKYYKIA